MPYIGNRLKELRIEKKMTQLQLAEALHLSKSAIVQYEHNKREPNFESLNRIVSYFKVSPQYLIGKSNYRKLSEQIFYDDTIQKSEMFQNTNESAQRAIVSLFNNFNYELKNILAMDSQEKKEKVLIHLIDIFNNIWRISQVIPLKEYPEMYDSKKLSNLELYKLQEKHFQSIAIDIETGLKEIFDVLYDDLYEEYCKRYSSYAHDDEYIQMINDFNKETFEQKDK